MAAHKSFRLHWQGNRGNAPHQLPITIENVPFTLLKKKGHNAWRASMPFELPLPKKLKAEGWKVKIREKERVEPPHVTVMHKARQMATGAPG